MPPEAAVLPLRSTTEHHSSSGLAGFMARLSTSKAVSVEPAWRGRPLLRWVQVAPPSVLRNTPAGTVGTGTAAEL